MNKVALILIFVFIVLPIILIGVLGADIYLTVSNFSPSKVSLNVSTPNVGLSPDNSSIVFSTNITLTTPPAGFIPKSLTATITLFYNKSIQLGNPLVISLQLGKTVTDSINQSIPLTTELTQAVSQGKSVAITIKTSANISLFGITIPYTFNVPDQTINVP